MFRLGLDIGGTFSDLAVYDTEKNAYGEFKSLTTYDSVESVANCLAKAAEANGLTLDGFLAQVELFCFGSTHALNTLLTETGSRVGIPSPRWSVAGTSTCAKLSRRPSSR
jgi:N-methylhydantoinase A